jgi:glycerol-1-phosphate dehydrogenase [NAD(P)+]
VTRHVAIPGLMEVGTGLLPRAGALLAGHGLDLRRVLVGSGDGPTHGPACTVADSLRDHGATVLHAAPLDGTLERVAAVAAQIIEREVTLAVAVGGGRVIDTVKLAAARTGVPFVSLPTAISNDGISSPVASIRGHDGRRVSHAARMPDGLVVDLGVVGSAPVRTLRAGIGDLVSNLTALLDWEEAGRLGHDRFDAYSAMIAEGAARPALDVVDLAGRGTHEVVAKGLLLSGLAMAAAGTSRPCSGAEHLVSHALDDLLGTDAALHGEQVALGCLVSAAAHGSALLPTLRRLFTELGLPTRPADLGLSDAQVAEAVRRAPSMRPDRWTVLTVADGSPAGIDRLLRRAFAPARVRQPAPDG